MKLFLWWGLDAGGEYADSWITVIAKSKRRALELIDEYDHEDNYLIYSGECSSNEPEVLSLRGGESERIWAHG